MLVLGTLAGVAFFLAFRASRRAQLAEMREQAARQEADKLHIQLAAAERAQEESVAAVQRQHDALMDSERRGHSVQIEGLRRATDEKLALVAGGREEFIGEMKAISGDLIKQATEQLHQIAQESRKIDLEAASGQLKERTAEIKNVLAPVAEHLERVENQVRELDRDRKGTEGSVAQMFRNVNDELGRLRAETGQLVSALKRPEVRGAWGEMQLRNVVRAANMTDRVDFHVQPTLDNGPDSRLRPDMTIHLPTERDVVVDSKVPLDAYLAAVECGGDEREGHLDRHAKQLRSHLDKLASKGYHARLDTAAEFVVCFLPNEAVYCAALDRDPTLLEHGATKGVLIATPTTLLALLYACAYGWRQAAIEESAREIASAARELHKRCGKFIEDFAKIGRMLGSAVNAYNSATGSLEARVLPQLRRMEDAGAASERVVIAPTPLDTPARLVTAPEASASIDGPPSLGASADAA
jgi:DNA recombination protein RmuC